MNPKPGPRRTVRILHQCLVGGKAARVGQVIEIDDETYMALMVARRIAPGEPPRNYLERVRLNMTRRRHSAKS